MFKGANKAKFHSFTDMPLSPSIGVMHHPPPIVKIKIINFLCSKFCNQHLWEEEEEVEEDEVVVGEEFNHG